MLVKENVREHLILCKTLSEFAIHLLIRKLPECSDKCFQFLWNNILQKGYTIDLDIIKESQEEMNSARNRCK